MATVVVSEAAASGLPGRDGAHYAVADDDEAFARRALELLAQPETARQMGEAARRLVLETHRLENEADDTLNQKLAILYDGVAGIPELISQMRWGEICGLLEDATDRAEDVADVLEGIYFKNG